MKLCSKILAIAIIAAFTYSLTGCAAPSSFTYSNVGIAFTAQCSDCPNGIIYSASNPAALLIPNQLEGGVVLWTVSVTNAPSNNLTWALYPTPNLGDPNPLPTGTATPVGETNSAVGYFQTVSGNTAYYQMNGVPTYTTGAALVQAQDMQYTVTYPQETLSPVGVPLLTTVTQQMTGIPQGDVLMSVSVPNDPSDPSSVYTAYQLMQIYANSSSLGPPSLYLTPHTPTTPSGLTTSVVTVPHGTSYQFFGGVVGAAPCTSTANCLIGGVQYPLDYTDNTAVWSVGATTATVVAGGSTLYGTITSTGLYTAPATVPATQPVVTVSSQLSPGVTPLYAYITVN
jgi:hypothetical protein